MQKKSTLFCQHQRMCDTQHSIDRVRVSSLVNGAGARGWIPFGAKIAALHEPSSGDVPDAHIRVWIVDRGWRKVNLELEFRAILGAHESSIPVVQQFEKIRIRRVHADGYAANGNHRAVALNLCG